MKKQEAAREEEEEEDEARERGSEKAQNEGRVFASRKTNKHELCKPIAQHCCMGKEMRSQRIELVTDIQLLAHNEMRHHT